MHQLRIEGGYKPNKSKLTSAQKESDSALSCKKIPKFRANLSSRLFVCWYQDNLSSRISYKYFVPLV